MFNNYVQILEGYDVITALDKGKTTETRKSHISIFHESVIIHPQMVHRKSTFLLKYLWLKIFNPINEFSTLLFYCHIFLLELFFCIKSKNLWEFEANFYTTRFKAVSGFH